MLAAEFALGILEGDERARALRLQLADVAFRADVVAWQSRFEPLFQDYGDLEAPDVWRAIELRISGEGSSAGIQRRLTVWRRGALVAGALAATLAVVLLVRPMVSPPKQQPQIAQSTPSAVARLGAADAAHQFAVNYDEAKGELRIRTLKMPQSGLTPELWIIPADNVPRSLGLVKATGSTRIRVAPSVRPLLVDGVTLAITMEKREGAPHAAPTSAPVAAGPINSL